MKKMKNKIGIIVVAIIFGLSIGIITKDILQTAHYKKVESYNIQGKIKITKEFINVREQPSTKAKKVFEALQNEEYQYIETFKEENGVYTWYKIIFSDRRIGWIASYDEEPWVKELKQ